MPDGAVCVTRPTEWGNPFVVGDMICIPQDGGTSWLEVEVDPTLAVALFESWVAQNAEYVDRARAELGGRVLACWCPLDQPCHADVLLGVANASTEP
jgi:hypothetical protein